MNPNSDTSHYDAMQIINMVARMYDPFYGGFISVDPLADKYPGVSAYVYCANNPLLYWDPSGGVIVPASGMSDKQLALFDKTMKIIEKTNPDAFKAVNDAKQVFNVSFESYSRIKGCLKV